jgi:tetratricopeptide (TPR) repeat protein
VLSRGRAQGVTFVASSSTFSGSGGSDEFTSGVGGFFDLLAKRSKLLVAVGVLVVIAIAVLALLSSQNEQKADAARGALFLAEKSLDTQLEAIAKATVPAPAPVKTKDGKTMTPPVTADAIQFKKLDVDTQLADGVTKLKAVAQDFSKTHAGYEAMMLLGKTYLNHGNATSAAEWFQMAAKNSPTPLDRALTWQSLAYAYENGAKYKEALQAYDSALKSEQPLIKADVLLGEARVYEEMNTPAQAKEKYDLVIALFPNTPSAKQAELFKARLK